MMRTCVFRNSVCLLDTKFSHTTRNDTSSTNHINKQHIQPKAQTSIMILWEIYFKNITVVTLNTTAHILLFHVRLVRYSHLLDCSWVLNWSLIYFYDEKKSEGALFDFTSLFRVYTKQYVLLSFSFFLCMILYVTLYMRI